MKNMTSRAHHLRSCSMVKTDDRRVLSSINPIMLTKIQSPLNLLSPSFSIYIDPSRILGSKAASCSQFPWYSHPQDHEIEKSHVPTSHTTCRSYSSVHPAVQTKRHQRWSSVAPAPVASSGRSAPCPSAQPRHLNESPKFAKTGAGSNVWIHMDHTLTWIHVDWCWLMLIDVD